MTEFIGPSYRESLLKQINVHHSTLVRVKRQLMELEEEVRKIDEGEIPDIEPNRQISGEYIVSNRK